MINFHIRKFDYLPAIPNVEFEEYTKLPLFVLPNNFFDFFNQDQTSLFDVSNLREAYILSVTTVFGTQFLNSPVNPFDVRIKQITDDFSTPTYGRFIDGEVGDSNRKILIFQDYSSNDSLLDPNFNDRSYVGYLWDLAGYDLTSEATFLNDVCSQINQAIQLYQPLTLYNDFNVIFYKKKKRLITDLLDTYTILYYPGADPNADEVISI
jgi:hypothetical protein